MATRRFNCCVFNHPCPIFCPFLPSGCENEVVNPQIADSSFGFFSAVNQTVAPDGLIPLNLAQGNGLDVTQSTVITGAVALLAGTYQITFSAGGTSTSSGLLSVGLRLNGVEVSNSTASASATAGQTVNLTNTIVLTTSQGGILELVNNSANTTTYGYANLFVRSI